MKNIFLIAPFLLLYFFSPVFLFSQTDTLEIPIDNQLENIIEETIGDAEDSQLNEVIEDLIQNPIEINQATVDDLTQIPFIDLSLARAIINFRNQYGFYYTLAELKSVQGMTEELFNKISPFIYIDRSKFANLPIGLEIPEKEIRPSQRKSFYINFRQRFYQTFPKRKGYETGAYYNSPFKFYNRLTADYSKKYYFSFLTEKDPGEKSINDFVSGSLFVKDFLILKKFVIGDYALEFGQGLAMWRQIGFAKGSDAVYPIKKKGGGIEQYKSTDENQFFRGVALASQINDLEVTLFYSGNRFDARVDSINNVITSTPLDGYHRNTNELSRKNSENEKIIGSRVSYNFSSNQIGLNFYQSKFSKPIAPNSYFKNYEGAFNYISTDFNLFYETINLFGEISKDKNNHFATLFGLQSSISRSLSFVTVFRNFPAEYINIHGYGFGERNGPTNNERGFYLGIKHSNRLGTFNFYFDQFKFLYPLTYDKTLTGGKEFLLSYESPLISKTKYLLRYKNEIKEINSNSKDEFGRTKKISNTRQQQNLRLEIQKYFGPSNINRISFRIEYIKVFYKYILNSEDGLLTFGDVNLRLIENLKLQWRITYFQTKSYDSRIYQLENDVVGVFTTSALYGRGIRWYALLNYKVFDFLNLSLKYSEIYRDDVKKLGSGNDEIPTNLSNSFTLQLDVKF
ncbi:MAG: helix-hairpin-helix domain-containing protein [Ignavibacteria bacterium]